MKKELALKSTPQIVRTALMCIIAQVVAFSLWSYYNFQVASMPTIILAIFFVFIIVMILLFILVILMISNPRVMMEYDQNAIYIFKRKLGQEQVNFKDIVNVKATINIWAKPFLIYTALIIETDEKDFIIRNIDKIDEVRDMIKHLAFEIGEEK
ncbi:MAG: hypothetical protein CVV57_03140 [Tenericutes bacterium HGW-Tenericutes-2]|jgi:cbb3-type cytochrome oxidase subunit 3|nr:MAG: hypothetical protein CVV57_03140 [Tenericutes bacterium HGW-Tenericutes-2]